MKTARRNIPKFAICCAGFVWPVVLAAQTLAPTANDLPLPSSAQPSVPGLLQSGNPQSVVSGSASIAENRRQLELALAEQKAKIEQLEQHVIQQGNWIGQLLYRTEDMIDRQKFEAEARLLAPEFSNDELSLLNRWEISTAPLKNEPVSAAIPESPSPRMSKPNVTAIDGEWHRYWPGPSASKNVTFAAHMELKVSDRLPLPRLEIADQHAVRPLARLHVPPQIGIGDKRVSVYFEFDTVKSFDGPHFWRFPNLYPNLDKLDLTSRRGLLYHIFQTTLADYEPSTEVRFPFRASAMAYPMPANDGTGADLVKVARLLQDGLSRDDAIREVFNYIRHKYVWGGNTFQINALDTFRAGIAGCGDINELMGLMLELNGIRMRAVSGFNPIFRVWNPGGGHTAAEVFDGERWSFIDTFLGVYYPKLAAADFAKDPIGESPVAFVQTDNNRDPDGILGARFGSRLKLQDLFKYRIYSDKNSRLPVSYMLQLRGAAARNEQYPTEKTYGLSWKMRSSDVKLDYLQDISTEVKIYVRARYVVSKCSIRNIWEPRCNDQEAASSDWVSGEFTIKPLDLIQQK